MNSTTQPTCLLARNALAICHPSPQGGTIGAQGVSPGCTENFDPSPVRAAHLRIARSLVALATTLVILWVILSPLSTRAAADAPGDPVRGKQLFEKRCTGCHSLDADKEGPHLRGVYGRKAATAPGFAYSDALKAANFTWNDALLEKWLTDTESVVPDNNMDFHVPNPDERADIIGYLRVSSGH